MVVFPSSPTVGQQYTDPTSNTRFYWTGTYWRGVFAQGSKGDKGDIGVKGDKGEVGPIAAGKIIVYTRNASSNVNLSSATTVTVVGRTANTSVNLNL